MENFSIIMRAFFVLKWGRGLYNKDLSTHKKGENIHSLCVSLKTWLTLVYNLKSLNCQKLLIRAQLLSLLD